MFFSYSGSIIIMSLALYGLWVIINDLWDWLIAPKLMPRSSTSIFLMVKNMEQDIEEILLFLERKIMMSQDEYDVVIVDYGSDDLTAAIIERSTMDNDSFTFVSAVNYSRPVTELLPLCRGKVVHVLDAVNRLKPSEIMAVLGKCMIN